MFVKQKSIEIDYSRTYFIFPFMKVKFFANNSTERLKYILSFIAERIPSLEWEIQDLSTLSLPESEIHIIYGFNGPLAKHSIVVPDEGLLTAPLAGTYQHPSQAECKETLDPNTPFQQHLPFDILSFLFFQLSRMEEYTEVGKDKHNRFQAQQSTAFQYGYLSFPIVDIILQKFCALMSDDVPVSIPQSIISIDVDVAFAFQHKPFHIQFFSFLKDLIRRDFERIQSRIATYMTNRKDPYDTFDELIELRNKSNSAIIFFFLVGKRGPFDRNISPQRNKMKEVLLKISNYFEIGLHPSYKSNEQPSLVQEEKNILERAIQKKVTKSRQHYLKLNLPSTYQELIKTGIQEDYSMGYSDFHGYRAGTAGSFRWYDLTNEKTTNLRIFPFQIMDITLKKYLNWDPNQALKILEPFYKNQPFTIIWHNSNLSKLENWGKWKPVFESLISWQL